MSEKSLQVSVEDLQHIQLHLEGQEQALAAIAEHLRAFESDAGQFVEFQSDFIKTIGLIQDVHQYTKQQAQQWCEQLEQCSIAHQNALQLQHELNTQLETSSKQIFHELQSTLQHQQQHVEKMNGAITHHEDLLSNHSSIQLFEKIPHLIAQTADQFERAFNQTNSFIFAINKIELQQAQQAKQAAEKLSQMFEHLILHLRQQQTESELKDHKTITLIQEQVDQRVYSINNNLQNNFQETQKRQIAFHEKQEQTTERLSKMLEHLILHLRQQQTESELKDHKMISFIQAQIDQRVPSFHENIQKTQKHLENLHKKNHRGLQIVIVILMILLVCLAVIFNNQMQNKQKTLSTKALVLSPFEQQVITKIKSGSQDFWIDRKTNMMWLNCGLGQTWKVGRCEGELTAYTWSEAQAALSVINQNGGYAGYTDWRLPYITESFTIARCRSGYMRSIRIPSRESGNIVVSGHCRQANPIQIFWSNTVNSNSPSFAYSIDYGSATTKLSSKDQRYFVTLVRNP
jgi:hypothetical protein